MKNKGFTLIELIASIAILAMLSTIIVVAVSKSINKAKEDANATMLKAIRLAAEDYAVNNEGILTEFSANDWVDIKLETLIKNNYFDNELKDFVTKENIPITNVVRVSRSYNGKITATYDTNQNEITKISLNGSYNIYVKKGDTYEDEGVTATTPEGLNVSSSVVKSGTVNTNAVGTYVLTYTYQNISITRNVIVSETDNLVSIWHTLTVNPNGGTYSGSTSNIVYSIKEGRTQIIAVPTRTSYTFISWAKTCTSCYNTSSRVYTMGTANDTLTANWQINPDVTLTVNLNGGTTTQTFNATYTMGVSVSLIQPTRSGYVFTGWSASGTGASVTGSVLTIGTANTTLTANWLSLSGMYTYTQTNTLIDDLNSNWRIKFLASGTFTPNINMVVDVFLVGGGGGGRNGIANNNQGGGGGGGLTGTWTSVLLYSGVPYTITIGGGGSGNGGTGGTTSFSGSGISTMSKDGGIPSSVYYTYGGSGGSGGGGCGSGNGGSDGGNGAGNFGTGQGFTTREFGEAGGTLYAGGGGGGGFNVGVGGYGGAGGGGNGGGSTYSSSAYAGTAGTANTGGGGGGGGASTKQAAAGASGGSGIVVIRNHR